MTIAAFSIENNIVLFESAEMRCFIKTWRRMIG
jgi:hypothetical protein